MTNDDNGGDRLGDIWAIQQLKARYFRLMDTKDWTGWRELFTDDLCFLMDRNHIFPVSTEPRATSGDAFVEQVSRHLETAVSVHQGHMSEIEFTGERTARGIWAMEDWVDDRIHGGSHRGFGHYHEEYVKGDDGRWRIHRMHLTRIRVDTVNSTEPSSERPWPKPWSRSES